MVLWTRSPNTNNTNNFYYVQASGASNNNNANNSYGVLFGFPPIRLPHCDKVTFGRNRKVGREGAHDPPVMVNICPDASGRTLLAWRRLQVIRRFMPGDAMHLYGTCRQVYGAIFEV